MKHLFILTIISAIILNPVLNSQHFTRGLCGLHHSDQQLAEQLYPNDYKGNIYSDRSQVTYIPVKFHLTATNEGTGRIEWNHVLNQLCVLNSEFAESNIIFYMSGGFNFIDVTNIFENPATSNSLMVARKDSKSVNVFITENADQQGVGLGTVLGYYSPQGDYVVVRKQELINKSNTLSHEIGHFFSLRHTFYGWEGAPYDKNIHGEKVTFNFVPNGVPGVPVELMNQSNCSTAADMICDTPPDFNFGASVNNCVFNLTVFDRNDDRVIPMRNNQMSYFSACDTFRFTPGQTSRMLINFNSSGRSNLRSGYIPVTDTIRGEVVVRMPAAGATVPVFDGVQLDWDDVPGASHYLIEIRGAGQYYPYIVSQSELYVTDLRRNQFYTWSIRPFNETYACYAARTSTFRTGAGTVSTTDPGFIKSLNLYPNPSVPNEGVRLELTSDISTQGSISVISADGKVVFNQTILLQYGKNTLSVPAFPEGAGLYVIKVSTKEGTAVRKLIIY